MKKILCYRNSKLGDFLISIPAIKLIKKKNGNCKIYYLTVKSKFYTKLPEKLSNEIIVDKFIYFENTLKEKIKLINFLKNQNFNSFYYLQEKNSIYRELRDYFFFSLLHIPDKHGFFCKNEKYINESETIQIAKRVENKISVNDIYSLIKQKKISDFPIYNFNYISISIGGFSQPTVWKLKNWNILLRLILNNLNYKIIITGTKEDIKSAKLLCLINPKRIISLCGKNNLDELLNIIKFSKLHVTNDNGSMHLATLFSKKTLCLFNNHDPEGKWYPANKKAIKIRSNNGINSINPYFIFKKLNRFI